MADEPIRGMRSGREQARRDRLARKLRESRRATRERKPTVPTTPASPPPSGPRRPSWVGKQFGKYTEGVKDRFSGEGGSIATGLPILAILAGILLLTLFVFKGKWFGWVAFGLVMLIFWKKIPQIWRTLAILVGCMIFFKGQFFVWMFWVAFALAVLELIFRLLMQVLPESVIKLIRGIIYLVLIGAIIWFLFNFFQTGGGTILGVEMENTGAYKTLEWVKNGAWTLFNKPGELFTYYSTWDQPEVAEENVKRGIEFYDIDTRRDYFKEGDPITLYFTSSVSALVDSDTVVTFGCEIDLKDNKTQAGTIVLSGLEGNEFTVFSGNDEDIDGTCTIPGVSLEEGKKSTKKGEEGVSIYAVNINGIYQNFESKSALKIYTIPSENLRDVDYSFYPELDKNHRAKTQCIRGCGLTKFSLKTAKQPQTNVGSYSLGIGIRKDIDWLGDLFKIKKELDRS